MIKSANVEELKHKKISKLVWEYSLPAIVGTTANALYNVIDRFFIGHAPDLGKAAMTAIGISLPVMIILTAVGMMIGAGSASRISIFLGQGNKHKAEQIIGNAFLLTLILTGGTSTLLYIFLDPILFKIGAQGQTHIFAHEFLQYYLPGAIFLTMCFSFNNMMRASGYPAKAMYTMLISVVANVILAPLFIFVFKWGIKGAALATVVSMFIGLCFVMQHFMSKDSVLRIRFSNIRLNKDIVKSIISIGLAPFIIQLSAAGITFLIISKLKEYGDEDAVGAYTIVNILVMLVTMSIVGLTQGMQPIVGYNYGAKNYKRVRETLNYTIKVGIGIGAIGMLAGEFFPYFLARFFTSDQALIGITMRALRIVTSMLPLIGFQIVVTNFFQSIGMAKQSIFLSLSRQVLMLIPALYILPTYFKLDGVWASLPTADFLATMLTLILFVWQMNKFKRIEQSQSKL